MQPQLAIAADALLPLAIHAFVEQVMNRDGVLAVFEKASQYSTLVTAYRYEAAIALQRRRDVVAKGSREQAAGGQRGNDVC